MGLSKKQKAKLVSKKTIIAAVEAPTKTAPK